jgi:hypothetical protein
MMAKIRNMKALFVLLFFVGDLLLTIYNVSSNSLQTKRDLKTNPQNHMLKFMVGQRDIIDIVSY